MNNREDFTPWLIGAAIAFGILVFVALAWNEPSPKEDPAPAPAPSTNGATKKSVEAEASESSAT